MIALIFTILFIPLAIFTFQMLPAWVEQVLNKRIGEVPRTPLMPEAVELHRRLFVADLHADTLLWDRDLMKLSQRGHIDLPRLAQGNVGLQVFAAVTAVPKGASFDETPDVGDVLPLLSFIQRWPRRTWGSRLQRALYQAERLHQLEAQSGGGLVIVKRRADFRRVIDERAAGKSTLGAMLALEGVHALEGDLANVARIEAAGFRIVGLTHFFDNEAAGSAHGVGKHGLSPFGAELVCLLEDYGLLIDLAHASPNTIDDVLTLTTAPVMVSHTGLNVAGNHPRRLACEQAIEIVRRGGLIGIAFFEQAAGGVSLDAVADAICDAASVVGISGIALGSDFDGAIAAPLHAGEMARITDALMQRGMRDAEIAKVMGGNALRFLERSMR